MTQPPLAPTPTLVAMQQPLLNQPQQQTLFTQAVTAADPALLLATHPINRLEMNVTTAMASQQEEDSDNIVEVSSQLAPPITQPITQPLYTQQFNSYSTTEQMTEGDERQIQRSSSTDNYMILRTNDMGSAGGEKEDLEESVITATGGIECNTLKQRRRPS